MNRPEDITYGMCPSTKLHRTMKSGNKKCVHVSFLDCAHLLIDIKLGRRIVSMRHRSMEGRISKGMHTLSLSCVHWLGFIGHGYYALDR